MNALNVHENQTLDEAFYFYKKIVKDLTGPVARVQNDKNSQKFKVALGLSIREVEGVYKQLNKIGISSNSELFKQALISFSALIVKLNSLKEDMALPYMLYVIGMGKAGKSSLLNSLVGSNVADVGTLPKTWKTDLFYKANCELNQSVKIIFRDGNVQNMSEKEAKVLIGAEEDKREDSEDLIDKEFKKQSGTLTGIEQKKVLRQELADKYLYRSSIREVRWALKNLKDTSVLNRFSLIDTPGLSQSHAGTHGDDGVRGEDIGDFYHHADGVLWVLDAMTLSASKPKEALDNLEKSLSHASSGEQGIGNIIAVLNHADKVITQGGEGAIGKVVEMAKNIFGNKFLDIVPYSAKQAVDALKNNDSDLLQRSGYNHLCDVTNQHFYYNAVNLRINSKAQGFGGEISTYQTDFFQPYLTRLDEDQQKLQERLEKAKKDSAHLQQQLESAWEIQFAEYAKIVEQNIQAHAEQLVDLPDSEHAKFMEQHVFKLELLKAKQSKYRNTSVGKVSEMVEKYRKYDAENFLRYKYIKNREIMAMHTGNSLQGGEFSSGEAIDFSGEDAVNMAIGGGLAVLGLALLGPIGLLAGAFMLWGAKDRKVNKAKASMRENLKTLEGNCIKENNKFLSAVFKKSSDTLQHSAENAFIMLHASSDQTHHIQSLFAKLDTLKVINFQKATFAHLLFEENQS